MLAMPTASEGAPPVRANSVVSPMSWASVCHLVRGDREAPARDGVHGCVRRGADDAGADVDREIHAGIEQRGRDDRHDGDEGFQRHAAVADQAHIALVAR